MEAPLLNAVTYLDGLMGALPPLVRITLWAVITGTLSMGLYKLLSPQHKLTGLKAEQKTVRNNLKSYDGEFSGMWKLIANDLRLSLKQMLMIFGPFVISVAPVIAVMLCLLVIYGYRLPAPGENVAVTISPPDAQVSWSAAVPQKDDVWNVRWPDKETIDLLDDKKQKLLSLPLLYPIPEIGKPSWMDRFVPFPVRTLPEDSAVESVTFAMPAPQYTAFGPDWMRGFEFWYILILLVVSLFIKFRFKIV